MSEVVISVEESDQLRRNEKKYKRHYERDPIDDGEAPVGVEEVEDGLPSHSYSATVNQGVRVGLFYNAAGEEEGMRDD